MDCAETIEVKGHVPSHFFQVGLFNVSSLRLNGSRSHTMPQKTQISANVFGHMV